MSDVERVSPARTLRGSLRVPGDKSTSHRALMISALASGESSISGLSPGEDVAATSAIVEQLGARRIDEDGVVLISGPDAGLSTSSEPLDCANSGTTMRLLCGVVSAIEGSHRLIGDASLSRRPMDRVARPLGAMGAVIEGQGDALTAPLDVRGSSTLRPLDYHVPIASAQVKSAVLLAALSASGETSVHEDVRTRATTEEMLRAAGVSLGSLDVGEGRVVNVTPGRPRRHDWFVPGDPSQAAFFAVLGVIHPDASLEVLNVESSPERVGYVGVLERMGAKVTLVDVDGRVAVRSMSSELASTEIHARDIPSVDEVPVLTVAACAARGVSAFRSMGELRLKESDRFEASLSLARALGARAWSEGDDFFVEGLASAGRFSAFSISASLDHRMVMASAIAGCAGKGCTIEGASTVSSSYPNFFRDLALLQ